MGGGMLQSLAMVAALLGMGLAAYLWQVEGTGITGTAGALLALLGAGAAFLGAILAAMMRSWRRLRGVVTGLALLAATLTAVAAWFLMQNVLVIVMAVAALALLLDLAFTPARRGVI